MRQLGAVLAVFLASCGPKLMHGITPATGATVEEAPRAAPDEAELRAHASAEAASLELELEEGYFRATVQLRVRLNEGSRTLYLYGDAASVRKSALVGENGGAERPLSLLPVAGGELCAVPIPSDVGREFTLELRMEGPLDGERTPFIRVRDGGSEYWIPPRGRSFLRPLFVDLDHLGGIRQLDLALLIGDRLHVVGSLPISSRVRAGERREGKDRVVFRTARGVLARELAFAIGPFDKIERTLTSSTGGAIRSELFATRGRGVQLAPTAAELSRSITILETFRGEPIAIEGLRLLVSPFFRSIPYGLLVLDEETGLAHSQRESDRADLFTITRAIAELTLRSRFMPLSQADEVLLWAMAYREALDAIDDAEPDQRMSEFFARSIERRKRMADLGGGVDEFRLISLIEALVEERGEEGYHALFAAEDEAVAAEGRAPLRLDRLVDALGESAPSFHGLARVVFERSCSADGGTIEASIRSGPKTRVCVAVGEGDKMGSRERRCFTLDPEDALPETIELIRCDEPFGPNLEGFGFYRSRLSSGMNLEFLRGRFERAKFAERAAFYHDAVDAAEYGEIDAATFEAILRAYARAEDPLIARLPLRDLGRLLDEVAEPAERDWVASQLETFYLVRFKELGFERGGGEFDEALRAAIGEQLFRAPRNEALKRELLVRARAYLGLGARGDRLALADGLVAPALAFLMGELGEEAIEAVIARFRQSVTNRERGMLFQALLRAEHPLAAARVRELALEPVLAKESTLAILEAQVMRASSRKDALDFIREEGEALNLKLGERADVELALLAGALCEDVGLADSALPLEDARNAGYAHEVDFALSRASSCRSRMHHLRRVNAELAGKTDRKTEPG